MAIINGTKDNFKKEVLEAELPVLVDFCASWCGPCKMLSPLVDEVAGERSGRLKTVKVNVDEEPELSMMYDVFSIPTLILFQNGTVVRKTVGYMPKEELEAFVG